MNQGVASSVVSPSGFTVFLRVDKCGACGGKIKIVRDRANPKLVYRETHEAKPGEICPGSETEADEVE